MARIITKELALKIRDKLKAKRSPGPKNRAHELYDVEYEGVLVAQISIRHGSSKDQGHDHLPGDLFLRANQAKRLGQCTISREGYFDILREKGDILPPEDDEVEPDDESAES